MNIGNFLTLGIRARKKRKSWFLPFAKQKAQISFLLKDLDGRTNRKTNMTIQKPKFKTPEAKKECVQYKCVSIKI